MSATGRNVAGNERRRRHVWDDLDVCVECGLRRDGYSGGRTGMLMYTDQQGLVTYRAGECPGPQKEAT
jgi:hypothetical protein